MEVKSNCIRFSEEIQDRARVVCRSSQLLTEDVHKTAIAICQSGMFLNMVENLAQRSPSSAIEHAECLEIEARNQQLLAIAGITNDADADRWLKPVEKELAIALAEYERFMAQQARDLEAFREKWKVFG